MLDSVSVFTEGVGMVIGAYKLHVHVSNNSNRHLIIVETWLSASVIIPPLSNKPKGAIHSD
ncbi:hypothetical protein R50073_38180 [Maricurvus nonylphenolicus]